MARIKLDEAQAKVFKDLMDKSGLRYLRERANFIKKMYEDAEQAVRDSKDAHFTPSVAEVVLGTADAVLPFKAHEVEFILDEKQNPIEIEIPEMLEPEPSLSEGQDAPEA